LQIKQLWFSKGETLVPENVTHHALGDRAAFQLANVTKTPPQYSAITPRWLVRLLDCKPLEAGTLRVNRVADEKAVEVVCGQKDEKALPETYVEYEEKPREYTLSAISAVLDVQTRVSDLYSNSYDQVREQLRLRGQRWHRPRALQRNSALNRQGIAVRAGHHCAQPILRRFGVESAVRPSLALYNTCEDIDALVTALWNLKQGHTSI